MTRAFGITGWKNSGKTTLTERLVRELSGRGYSVATVKHAHHAFDVDREGTDSWRHRQAGAREVAIVSQRRWALIHELHDADEPPLEEILVRLSPCDIVLVEGYKRSDLPKLETRRRAAHEESPLFGNVPNVVAIAADHPVADASVPVFGLDDVAAIADFVAATSGLAPRGAR